MRHAQLSVVLMGAMVLAACSTTAFHSTWKAPNAKPVSGSGEKVIALVASTNQASRRAGEDALARELTKRGAVGIPAYTVLGDIDLKNEGQVKQAFEKAGAAPSPRRRRSTRHRTCIWGPPMERSGAATTRARIAPRRCTPTRS